MWCQDNNLSLNVIKTKEMIVDYRKRRTEHSPILIDGAVVKQVEGKPQRVMRTAQYITGTMLPAIQDLYTRRCQRKDLKIVKTPATLVIHCSLTATGAPSLGPKGFFS